MAATFLPLDAEIALVSIQGVSKPKKLCTFLNLETQWVLRAERIGRDVHVYWRKNVANFAALKAYVEQVEKNRYQTRVSMEAVFQEQLSFLDEVDEANE